MSKYSIPPSRSKESTTSISRTWSIRKVIKPVRIVMTFRFIHDKETLERLRSCFAGLYSLTEGEKDVSKTIENAMKHPENYVLKPQREGILLF